MNNKFFIFCLISVIFFACKSDDSVPNNTQEPDSTDSSAIINSITNNGETKTWKIESAFLTNATVTDLDVTNAFNIKDDEFKFSLQNQVLNLEHKQRNTFNENASSYDEFLLDNYETAIGYILNEDATNYMLFANANNTFEITYQNENAISGEWKLSNNTKLEFNLSQKSANDYQSAPSTLNFEEVIGIPINYNFRESLGSSDIVPSQSGNSLYLAYGTDGFENPNGGSNRAECLIRFDIESSSFYHNIFHNSDLLTKRLVVKNNDLEILGTRFIDTYDITNIELETSIQYNGQTNGASTDYNYRAIRYDIIPNQDNILIFGGNGEEDFNNDYYFDKVLSFNKESGVINELTTMPSPKSMAACERIDDKVYIFGGCTSFANYETAETLSYIYDINTNTFSTFNLPEALSVTFTTSVENIIYVAGQVTVLDADNNVTDTNAYLGAYNTEDGTFTEITHNLDDSDEVSRISGIAYNNGKLYLVYRSVYINNYIIMSADL